MNDPTQRLAAEIQDELSVAPVRAARRNINTDVHEGYAAQRPFAAVEDRMAGADRTWRSFDELEAALGEYRRANPEATGYEIEAGDDGLWVRWVPRVAETISDDRGVPVEQLVEDTPRFVALTRADARQMTQHGREADFFDGATWWRRGSKPERDLFVAEQQQQRRELRRVPIPGAAAGRGRRRERPAPAEKES